ncbi:MAG: DUF4258 domain-containing protein [Candidatus Kapabacteria bacterium]|nr:DUF4258 domain-containing protein [Candidatus Kapabacteria bacterium]
MKVSDYKFSNHLLERLNQRNLEVDWIINTIDKPDRTDEIDDDEIHYYKFIPEFFDKCLKVVVNPVFKIIVTAHFDRSKTKRGLL